MRILLCHNSYRFRGGEDQVFEDERCLLEEAGHTVSVFCRSNHQLAEQPKLRVAANTLWNRQCSADLSRLIRRERPEVVHFHNTFPIISPAAYYAVRRFKLPIVQTVHNYRIMCPGSVLLRDGQLCMDCVGRRIPWRAVRHRCYRNDLTASLISSAMTAAHWALGTWPKVVTRYIALTDFSRQMLEQAGIEAGKISIKPNFVRQVSKATQPGDYAIFVGRLSPEKGVSTLLRAWAQSIRMPLVIVGEGPLEPEVQRAAQIHNIRYEGMQSHASVMRSIANAKVLVFPSIWHETFGRSMIEAFASGTPVIATDMAPMNRIVEQEKTGLLFARDDAGELRRCVVRLDENPALLQRLSKTCYAEFLAKYTAKANLRMLMKVYQSAMEDESAGH